MNFNNSFLEFRMYYVYAISSLIKEYIYVGMSKDINTRIERHNKGYERTTKPYIPFELIYKEKCDSRVEARKREKYWKSGCGKEQLKEVRGERAGLSTDR